MILIEMKKTFNKTALLSSLFSLLMLVSLLIGSVTTLAQGGGGLPQTIAIEGGKISGLTLGENKDVLSFKGIPYVKPPIGPLRWKPPQPVETWEGVRQATAYGPACFSRIFKAFGIDLGKQSEDCLYLNVWTAAKSADERRPVMMWIHGGGNMLLGASQDPSIDGGPCPGKASLLYPLIIGWGFSAISLIPCFLMSLQIRFRVITVCLTRLPPLNGYNETLKRLGEIQTESPFLGNPRLN